MRVFLAGVPGGGTTGVCKRERELDKFWNKRLWPFYWILKDKAMIPTTKNNNVDLFLDSGAFSAWTQKVNIDIQEYISFVKENISVIDVYANLDCIGDAEGTWKNQMIMEDAGLSPVPCFHYGDDIKWLKRMVAKKYPYIALGGMVPISTENLTHWLDDLYLNYLTDSKGIPVCKVHGFGLTSLVLMLRYPWYSADSTSWVVTGRMGSIYVPRWRNGNWEYGENSYKIAVSNRSPSNKEAGQHYETMSPVEKRLILQYITEKGYCIGKSEFKKVAQDYELKENEKWAEKKPLSKTALRELEIVLEPGVSNKYQLRDEMNIIYFLDLEKSIQPWPWAFVKKEANLKFF